MGVEITIIKNGPAIINSTDEIIVNTEPTEKTRIALCRCGLSENKIYCDGSHKQIKEIEKQEIE